MRTTRGRRIDNCSVPAAPGRRRNASLKLSARTQMSTSSRRSYVVALGVVAPEWQSTVAKPRLGRAPLVGNCATA